MARKRLGAATAGSLVTTGATATIAPGANHNVIKSDGTNLSSSPLSVADVLNEVYIDYVPKTSIGTTTDDAAAHALTDVQGVAASVLGILGINDVQTVTMGATGGTWAITYKGQTTPARAQNVSTAQLQTDLQALSTIGSGNVTVSGTAGVSYVITAAGSLVSTLLDDFEIVNGGQVGSPALTGGTATIAHTTRGGHRLYNTDSTSTTNSAIYRFATLANTCSFMGIEFDFGSTGSTITGGVNMTAIAATLPTVSGVLNTNSPNQVADSPCHADFFLDHTEFGIIQNGVVVVLFSYSYDVQFATNAYQYAEVGIDKYSSSISLRAPDQTVWALSHAVIGSTTARFTYHEVISANSTTNFEPQIARFCADSSPARINSSGGSSRTQSLITDGRAAARNYIPIQTLSLLDQTFANRRAKFDLAADANTAGVTSTMYVPARSGLTIVKVGSQTAQTVVQNTVTETNVINMPLGMYGNELALGGAGALIKFLITGRLTYQATSGTLTFKVYVCNVAMAQTFIMPTQGSGATDVPFVLELWAQVRTTGSSGTAIAGGMGFINPTTTTVIYIIPAAGTGLSTVTTINTTTTLVSSATVRPLGITATWATASATNILRAEVASIERPM